MHRPNHPRASGFARAGRFALLLLLPALFAALYLSGFTDFLTLDALKAQQSALAARVEAGPAETGAAYYLIYSAITALSVPGAAILTLAGGAIFGLWFGLVLVSFASVTGAVIAFLISRYLLRDWVERRFGKRIEAINRGIEKDGAFYLLSLRLNPVVPFFLLNLAMGLTRMNVLKFAAVSQVGMLPATFVYVNAGTQLARIESSGDILSPALILSLLLLSLFPLLAKGAANWLRKRRIYHGWRRPRRFDRNLIVIGAGAGGLVTAYIAASLKAKVTLIEAREMGGDCLNTGCVPSKTLIAAARTAHETGRAGIDHVPPFAAVMERVFSAIEAIAPNDSPERYRSLGVDVRRAYARLVDPWTVELDGGERLTARAIVIAAGAEPAVPEIPGLEGSGYLTSDSMWDALRGRERAPGRVAIVGGGPIGTELAQAFARLGSRVTQIEHGPRILPREDEEVADFVAERLRSEGVDIRTGWEAARVEEKKLILRFGTQEAAVEYDELIVAVGRKARLGGYGLEALGIETERTILVNDRLETIFPNIYAVGDVAGPYQFTHFAAHQAGTAAINALFGRIKRFRADYSVVPRVTFTDPEIASVGHNEQSATAAGIAYEIVRYDLAHLDRAVAEGAASGFVKILTVPGKDRILGATIVAAHAGELIAELTLAMRHRIGLKKILGTIHAYPTMAEANRYAAGEWRKAHKPEGLLALVERYHRWRRG